MLSAAAISLASAISTEPLRRVGKQNALRVLETRAYLLFMNFLVDIGVAQPKNRVNGPT
jgi:hypothetical protein